MNAVTPRRSLLAAGATLASALVPVAAFAASSQPQTVLSPVPSVTLEPKLSASDDPILGWYAEWAALQPISDRLSERHDALRAKVVELYGPPGIWGRAVKAIADRDPLVVEWLKASHDANDFEVKCGDLYSKILETPASSLAGSRAKLLMIIRDMRFVVEADPGGNEALCLDVMQDAARLLGEWA